LSVSLAELVKEAMEGSLNGFNETVEESIRVLGSENGKVGDLEVVGRLVRMNPSGEALVVGDLHGDLESLVHILQESDVVQRMSRSDFVKLVFLGDYGDRGNFSPEVIWTVLKLKLQFPSQVVLMRGNHEGPKEMLAYPHDLPSQLKRRFGRDSSSAYDRLFDLFGCLYTAVLVRNVCVMVHGGPSTEVHNVKDLANAHTSFPKSSVLEDVLWSDPSDYIKGVYPSSRGAGKLFGKDVTVRFLRVFRARFIVRGHESCDDGFRIDHDGRVLTLFSRKGSPYFNAHGAYLDVEMSEEFHDVAQLIPYVHEF
jgi:protein phosphatase